MTRHKKVGIIAAPERAADISEAIIDLLPKKSNAMIDSDVVWEMESVIDPLTGAAETSNEILHNAVSVKENNGWDYAICLTDLPIYHKKDVVAADISLTYHVAQISLPSYGWPPMKKRISRTILFLLNELHTYTQQKSKTGRTTNVNSRLRQSGKQWRFPIKPVRRQDNPIMESGINVNDSAEKGAMSADPIQGAKEKDEQDSRNINVRYLLYPRIFANLRLLIGMTFANNPLKIMSSFKSIIAIAFTTGAFALIFPTIWKWGQIFSTMRLTAMMLAAIVGIVVWIITIHHLWEPPSSKNKHPIRRLYNFATISTLTIDVVVYYFGLYILFFIAAVVFIPQGYLEKVIPDTNDSAIISYMRVAWIEASIATLVSAMGAGLEDDQKIRNLTHGYRQKQRYQEMKKHANS